MMTNILSHSTLDWFQKNTKGEILDTGDDVSRIYEETEN